jgi:hypothetical protein
MMTRGGWGAMWIDEGARDEEQERREELERREMQW